MDKRLLRGGVLGDGLLSIEDGPYLKKRKKEEGLVEKEQLLWSVASLQNSHL